MSEIEKSLLSFSVESAILRELGERLVKRPEIALMELIKNSHDADATECKVFSKSIDNITIVDDGNGMTFDEFKKGWMRIGTHSKSDLHFSPKYNRKITGEKGLGRFSVRFLGFKLNLKTVAFDKTLKRYTSIDAKFDWPKFDQKESIEEVKIPIIYDKDHDGDHTGTRLEISKLRVNLEEIDYPRIRTSTLDLVSPIYNLFSTNVKPDKIKKNNPGFYVKLQEYLQDESTDHVESILNSFTLQTKVHLVNDNLELSVYGRNGDEPIKNFIIHYPNDIKKLSADIRFYPKRKGVFINLPVSANKAYKFIRDNSGVAVFDRGFRVEPYGNKSDDWLELLLDAGKSLGKPRSTIAQAYFPPLDNVPSEKLRQWMLRLPKSNQLIGFVEVEGEKHDSNSEKGLIASADREGFIENSTYDELFDIIRGATEAIAYFDRILQLKEQELEQAETILKLKTEAQDAIEEIKQNPNIDKREKIRLTNVLTRTFSLAEKHDELAREREQQLEIMSLLGVVAGFMTHEFGIAIFELESVKKECLSLAKESKKFIEPADRIEKNIQNLKDFAMYTEGYIRGVKHMPAKKYPVKPRIDQVINYFGKYAKSRNIKIINDIDSDLMAPLVPAALYNGIALNLYTNAIKAITAKISNKSEKIKFKARNESSWHVFEVLDSGIGIPSTMKERVFEPFFTTSESNFHPLDSGMGLGLALVQRVMRVFGGNVEFLKAPAGYSTCIQVKLPLQIKGE